MTVYLLVGEQGAGKTTIGKALAAAKKLPFFDGDDVLPQKLLEKTRKGWPLTPDEIHEFIQTNLVPLARQASEHSKTGLVFAQALYVNAHRRLIMKVLTAAPNPRRETGEWVAGVDFKVVRILPGSTVQHLRQLYSRPHGLKQIITTLTSTPWFERRGITHSVLNNAEPHAVVEKELRKHGAFE